ncbi:terpene synthase family protein [Actinoallomurus sp. NPDC052274]|uniref:terpene synthase family protein n=1 Tax=Actinoallomurus sp. NPDC052274 TaxID=3155420 RepID=UPI003434DC65
MTPTFSTSPRTDAFFAGAAAAKIRACEQDLVDDARRYPDLFPDKPFATVYGEVAKTMVFSAPWCAPDDLAITCRTILWIFALDWLVDHVAESRRDVADLTAECLAVRAGRPPGSSLARMLFDIREDLRAEPMFAQLGRLWDEELTKMIDAMSREWDWKRSFRGATPSAVRPTLEEYLANSANFGCTFTNVTFWISSGDPEAAASIEELRPASDTAQRALRLVNDLASSEREKTWGDINVFALGLDRAQVVERIARVRRTFEDALLSLDRSSPVQADFLRRQLEYSVTYYSDGADYWYAD